MIVKDFVDLVIFLSIKCNNNSLQVVLSSVSLEAMQLISPCGSNATSYQREDNDTAFRRQRKRKERYSAAYELLPWLPQESNVNMKRVRRSLVRDRFEQKTDEVHCKHCEAVYKYNMTTTPMMSEQ